MDNEKMQELIKGIQTKLGEQNSGLIADDLGIIITANTNLNNTIKEKDNEIQKLNNDNNTLLKANGNLLLQVSSNKNTDNTQNKDNKNDDKEISFDDIFDKKGNFK